MDDQSVDRIIDAVGPRFIPADLDKRALRHELQWCRTKYKNACDLSPLAHWQKRLLEFIKSSASRLKLQLDKKKNAKNAEFLSRYISFSSQDLCEELQSMIDVIDCKRKSINIKNDRRAFSSFTDRSPLELLAGKYLPRVYERLFGRSAAFSRSRTGRPIGPYIRFAKSALEELKIQKANGEQYSPETIARALTRVCAEQEKRAASTGRRRRHKLLGLGNSEQE